MNRRIIILIPVITILILSWVLMVHLPARRDLGGLSKRLSALEEEERRMIPEHKIRTIRIEVDSLSDNLDERLKRFYPEEQLIDLGQSIESIGKKYSLRLISITPDYESLPLFMENDKEISELPVTIEFKGYFEQLTRFLDDMPEFPFVMRFHGMVFQKKDSSKKELDILIEGVIALQRTKPLDEVPKNEMASADIANRT